MNFVKFKSCDFAGIIRISDYDKKVLYVIQDNLSCGRINFCLCASGHMVKIGF